MDQKNMKQIELVRLAETSGIKLGKSQISQYLSGKTLPRKDTLQFLSAVLEKDPAWLLGKETTPKNVTEKGSEDTMRKFSKSNKLDNVLYDVRGPVVDEAARMEEEGTQVLKLNIGNPAPFGFQAPDEVIYDMRRQLTKCEGYSDSKGLFSARKAIMQYAQLKHIPNVTMDGIYTGNGVSELINLSMSALLNSGDEVLLPSPDYPLWTACVTLAGGTAVHYLCDEQSDWYPDIADIRRKVTPKTKAIVLINPNNPTGALYPKEVLLEIVKVARENQLIIFSDEIYDRLVMDGLQHVSTAALAPDLTVVTMNGLSKSHSLCGYRCGWMIISGPRARTEVYRQGIVQLTSLRLCSNALAQLVIPAAIADMETPAAMVRPGGRLYEQRKATLEVLDQIDGVSYVKNVAAFYLFPKLDVKKFNIRSDKQFAADLLDGTNILVVPGSGFDWPEPDHLRLVMLPQPDKLREAMIRFGKFLDGYQQK